MKDDISCLGKSKYLLSQQNKFLLCTNIKSEFFGCYLFFDMNDNVWIRSGKATGVGGIGGHVGEHKERAESNLNEDESKFYHLYPSLKSTRSHGRGTSIDGLFENLVASIAFSFDGDDDELATQFSMDYNYGYGGIFFYTADKKVLVRCTNFCDKDGNRKFMEMAAYLFELGYNLTLYQSNNVSKSPLTSDRTYHHVVVVVCCNVITIMFDTVDDTLLPLPAMPLMNYTDNCP